MTTITSVYVRYLGDKVCYTCIPTGAFYIGPRDELPDDECALCDNGGGHITDPIRCEIIALVAK